MQPAGWITIHLPSLLRQWIRNAPDDWDILHIGVNPDHGHPKSPISTECQAKPDCYHGWILSALEVPFTNVTTLFWNETSDRDNYPGMLYGKDHSRKTQLWRPRIGLHGFLGYVLSPSGAAKLLMELPGGADIDGWYAEYIMNVAEHGDWTMGGNEETPTATTVNAYAVWPNWVQHGRNITATRTHGDPHHDMLSSTAAK